MDIAKIFAILSEADLTGYESDAEFGERNDVSNVLTTLNVIYNSYKDKYGSELTIDTDLLNSLFEAIKNGTDNSRNWLNVFCVNHKFPQALLDEYFKTDEFTYTNITCDFYDIFNIDPLTIIPKFVYKTLLKINNTNQSTDDIVNNLPTTPFCSSNMRNYKYSTIKEIYSRTECPLCLEKFMYDDDITVSSCSEISHKECFVKWHTKVSCLCPFCDHKY